MAKMLIRKDGLFGIITKFFVFRANKEESRMPHAPFAIQISEFSGCN